MKSIFWIGAFCCWTFSLSPAWAEEGSWKGKGLFLTGFPTRSFPIEESLRITLSEREFQILECFQGSEAESPVKRKCIATNYTRDDSRLFRKEKKVGDIFPNGIRIYEGNSQVGEQIQIEFLPEQKLKYRYNYMNFDGAFQMRESELSLQSP